MKFILICWVIVGFLFNSTCFADFSDLEKILNKIREAEGKKLPKTAISYAQELEKEAQESGEKGMYILAIAKRILNQANYSGKSIKEKIKKIQNEIKIADSSIRPILKTILAIWFWQYYEGNKHVFLSRSQTEGLDDDDFSKWDLSKLYREISKLFDEALKESSLLKKVIIKEYRGLIKQGSLPDKYCHTMYEFITREAIRFYQISASVLPASQDAFEIDSTTDAFAHYNKFLNYQFHTSDSNSYKLKALRLYQQLISFYKQKNIPDALLNIDLERHQYIFKKGVGPNRESIFIKRMTELEGEFSKYEDSTLALYNIAEIQKNKKQLIDAIRTCEKAGKRFYHSDGSKLCHNLKAEIMRKSYTISIEHSINKFNSVLFIKYKNVRKLYFRIIADDWEQYIKREWGRVTDHLKDEDIKRLLDQSPTKSWDIDLEPTNDFKFRNQTVKIPVLPNGFYRIFISDREDFKNVGNKQIVYTSFWRTNTLLLVKRFSDKIQAIVVDARNGSPMKKRKVKLFKKGAKGIYQLYQTLFTNKNGLVSISKKDKRSNSFILFVKSPKGDILFHEPVSFGYKPSKRQQQSVVFFTDRSIYRPGQTIFFKGICHSKNQRTDSYEVIPCKNIKVRLQDSNYQEIFTQTFNANAMGSFSGQFVAPQKVLTGKMTLSSDNPRGSRIIRVEEYKRPKFEVTLLPLEKEYRLNEKVVAKGTAFTFSGAPVNNAKAKYRVMREVQLPWWWRWNNPFQGAQEISNGITKTDEEGNFKLEFTAIPDRTIDQKINTYFSYTIEVDVIDPTGEARSATQTVNIGKVSLLMRMIIPSWLPEDSNFNMEISAKTLDGKPIESSGTVSIHLLKGPKSPHRAPSNPRYKLYFNSLKDDKKDLSDIANWNLGKKIREFKYRTRLGKEIKKLKLKAGAYRAVLTTKDAFGTDVIEKINFQIFPKANRIFSTKVPSFFQIKKKMVVTGEKLNAVWASGYKDAQAYISIIHDGEIIKSYWTKRGNKVHFLKYRVSDDLIGGFTLQVHFVYHNQIYEYSYFITVPRKDKELSMVFETFRSKLRPGEKESWVIKVKGEKAKNIVAEMVATLYDVSLDTIYPHSYSNFQSSFWKDRESGLYKKNLYLKNLNKWYWGYSIKTEKIVRTYPSFDPQITQGFFYLLPRPFYPRMAFGMKGGGKYEGISMMAEAMPAPGTYSSKKSMLDADKSVKVAAESKRKKQKVQLRTNLNETAFFFPHLLTNKKGEVRLEFNMPEALTRWKFLAMAHGVKLESGSLEAEVVTQKELMVQPHSPRFLRQGDRLFFTAKLTNLIDKKQKGKIELQLLNALNDHDVSNKFLKSKVDIEFVIEKKTSDVFKWELDVPTVYYPLIYRVTARSSKYSDGEENIIPILSRQVFVQESIPLWVSGPKKKKFTFPNLIESNQSPTLKNEKLVVQMSSNPAWYAVQALPYLSEIPCECSDQVFNRLYANSLAQKIANSNSKIEKIFKQWRGTDALKSNLEKNENLKNVLLQETPWVLHAQKEEKAKYNLGLFFDMNHMKTTLENAYQDLKNQMLSDGGWPWFPGGRRSDFITLYIVTGFGKLKHLKVDVNNDLVKPSIEHLDKWITDIYKKIRNHQANHYSNLIAFYLYGRSFFLKDYPIKEKYQAAINFYLNQAQEFWPKLNNLMGEAHTALGTWRFGKKGISKDIIKSLRERALHSEEMGMYWGEAKFSYWWYLAPVETQALIIELFSELANNHKEVERQKVWLLKQKQIQGWKSSKATADAVYALLLTGDDLLKSTTLVDVKLGNIEIKPEKVEVGTGFYQKRIEKNEIKSSMGNVILDKKDKGIAWGGLHWHYFEDISQIKSHQTPLKINKRLFVQKYSKKGPIIVPLEKEKIKVGDTLVVRIELQTDRTMEYVHMKDMRGSGTEPQNVLSQYKFQDGLFYYQSTKDTATHFYFDYLPKGNYIFEYKLKVFHKGKYEMGMAQIQSYYAPEFSSHSKSITLEVYDD